MPDWIGHGDLLEYFFYYKNRNNCAASARKLLQLADFFKNNELTNSLINEQLIPNLSIENSFAVLEDSYQKLTTSKEQIEKSWFDLFLISIDNVSKNLNIYVKKNLTKLKHTNKKLLEEIIER